MPLSFAPPISGAIPSSPERHDLIKHGKVVRGWLGASIQELTDDLAKQFDVVEVKGVLVSDVMENSPAAKAKLERGDIIREINRKRVRTVEDFERLVDKLEPQASALLLVHRGTASVFLSIKPE